MANVVTTLSRPAAGAFTVLPSAARTATPDSQEFEYSGAGWPQGLVVVVDATAVALTPLLTVEIAAIDRASGKKVVLLTSAVISTVSTVVLRVHPQLTAAANLIAKDNVPSVFRITATHGDADSITYSIGGMLTG